MPYYQPEPVKIKNLSTSLELFVITPDDEDNSISKAILKSTGIDGFKSTEGHNGIILNQKCPGA